MFLGGTIECLTGLSELQRSVLYCFCLHRSGGPDGDHDAAKTVDGDTDTYWTTNEGTTVASLEYDLGHARRFNLAVLQEYVQMGQRIEQIALDIQDGQGWNEIARGTTVGQMPISKPISKPQISPVASIASSGVKRWWATAG